MKQIYENNNTDNMTEENEEDVLKVLIVRNPNQYIKVGEIDIDLISNVHWDDVCGGICRRLSHYTLMGYIDYDLAADMVDCSGRHNRGYNSAKIAIPLGKNQDDAHKEAYDSLLQRAGEKPKSKIWNSRKEGFPPCTKYILNILKRNDGSMLRGLLRKKVRDDYRAETFTSALWRLKITNRVKIIKDESGKNLVQVID